MNSADLQAEMDAVQLGLPVVDARIALVRAGVPLEALRGPFPVGHTRIETDGTLYQPSPAGRPAYVIPEPVNVSNDWAAPDWRVLDLVAVTLNPFGTYSRKGIAWCLGAHNVQHAIYTGQPLRVHPTPFLWLRAKREGVCILEDGELWTRLGWCTAVVGQDLDHARKLRSLLTPPDLPVPQVLVPSPEAHAHA